MSIFLSTPNKLVSAAQLRSGNLIFKSPNDSGEIIQDPLIWVFVSRGYLILPNERAHDFMT